MNTYENIVIFDSSLSDEAVETSTAKIKDLITGAGGEILKVDNWGKRKLAYEINKQTRGVFILFLFHCPASVIKQLEDFYKVHDPVIKYMVIKLEKKPREAALAALVKKVEAPATGAVPTAEAAVPTAEAPVAEKHVG